jgi:hypothetical protein
MMHRGDRVFYSCRITGTDTQIGTHEILGGTIARGIAGVIATRTQGTDTPLRVVIRGETGTPTLLGAVVVVHTVTATGAVGTAAKDEINEMQDEIETIPVHLPTQCQRNAASA